MDEAERLIRGRASTTANVIISNHAFDQIAGGRDAGAATIIIRDEDTLFVKTVMWMDWRR